MSQVPSIGFSKVDLLSRSICIERDLQNGFFFSFL